MASDRYEHEIEANVSFPQSKMASKAWNDLGSLASAINARETENDGNHGMCSIQRNYAQNIDDKKTLIQHWWSTSYNVEVEVRRADLISRLSARILAFVLNFL